MILIDDVLPHAQTNTLAVVMLAMMGLYIIETILNTLVDWMMFSSFTRLSTDISLKIFKALFRLPLAFFTSNRVGDTVSKILSLNTLRTYFSEKPMKLIMEVFFGFALKVIEIRRFCGNVPKLGFHDAGVYFFCCFGCFFDSGIDSGFLISVVVGTDCDFFLTEFISQDSGDVF
jgi:ABC-type multidrug transport system fused ATPase/permease subunit